MPAPMNGRTLLRYACVALAAVLLLAAVVSFIGLRDRVESTSPAWAGASTAFAFLAYALRRAESGVR